MARIEGVPKTTRNPLLRLVFWIARRRFGRDVEPLHGYARSPAVLTAMLLLEAGMERARRVDERLRKLAELRVASLVGCPFCLDIGSALVRKAGVGEAQIRALDTYRDSEAFSRRERAALHLADCMTQTPVQTSEEDLGLLREFLDEPQILELVAAIAHENLRGRINHALGYGAQGFSAGGVCALAVGAREAVLQH